MTAEAQSLWSNPIVPEERTAEAVAARSLRVFEGQLAQFGNQVPEVDENREAINGAAADIITNYELQPSLFEDEGRSIVFTAIASRWAKNASNQDPKQAEAEKTFLSDSLALLAYNHSPVLEQFKPEIENSNGNSVRPETELAIYDKYTDAKTTADLKKAIDAGLLDAVKERLGVTSENEEPYDIRVLTIDPDGQNAGQISAPTTPYEEIPGDLEEKQLFQKVQSETYHDIQKQKADLKKRAVEMKKELGSDNDAFAAWVEEIGPDKVKTICVAMPLAEKLMHPELLTDNPHVDSSQIKHDQALLEHEYTHLQGGSHVDSDSFFGINVEERRAEWFSGDKNGYQNVKGFFTDIGTLTGFNLKDYFAANAKGGSISGVYSAIANTVGIDRTLEVLMAAPREYYQQPKASRFQKAAIEYIGEYDGVISRIYDDEIAKGRAQQIEVGINARAERILEVEAESGHGIGAIAYRRGHGNNFLTDLIEEKVRQQMKQGSKSQNN